MPLHIAALAAGLVVLQFSSVIAGRKPVYDLQLDLRTWALTIRNPA